MDSIFYKGYHYTIRFNDDLESAYIKTKIDGKVCIGYAKKWLAKHIARKHFLEKSAAKKSTK